MAEGTYEYECMRAELLGLEKPDYETFMANQKEKAAVEEEEAENEMLKNSEEQNEHYGRVAGGLRDINNILHVTQKKLNTFKSACGSLTNLLKIKVGQSNETLNKDQPSGNKEEDNCTNGSDGSANQEEEKDNGDVSNGQHKRHQPPPLAPSSGTPRKSDLTRALDNNVDKLDSLINQADNASFSMAHQTKQMKGFLRK